MSYRIESMFTTRGSFGPASSLRARSSCTKLHTDPQSLGRPRHFSRSRLTPMSLSDMDSLAPRIPVWPRATSSANDGPSAAAATNVPMNPSAMPGDSHVQAIEDRPVCDRHPPGSHQDGAGDRAFANAPWARCRVVCTGQHRELMAPILTFFGIRPDLRLDAMRPGQPVAELAARMIASLRGAIASERPDLVLAQGDTDQRPGGGPGQFLARDPFRARRGGAAVGQPRHAFSRGGEPGRGVPPRLDPPRADAAVHAQTCSARESVPRRSTSREIP